jgi:hypothetical protein
MAKYFNTKTGQETNIFSEVDWKSGQPQRAGWIDTESAPLKSKPKEIVDFVFKKPTERPPANVDKVIAETLKPEVKKEVKSKVLTVKKAKNDNPGKRRTPGKRN